MFKHKKLFFLALIFLLAIMPLVLSVSPFISQTSGGCIIIPMMRESIKVNQAFDFNFHVLNATNGYPISNTSISCVFHLYNQTGDHSYAEIMKNDPYSEHFVINEFVARLSAGNFSTVGDYAYQVNCNGTIAQGGCGEKGLFTVTNSGYIATTGRAVVDIGLLLVLIIFLAGCVLLFITNDNLLARVGSLGIGYLLLIAITFISWQMGESFLISAPFIASMFEILFYVLIIGLFPLIIGAFAWYVIMLFKIKEIENLMKHGMSQDEAERRVSRRRR